MKTTKLLIGVVSIAAAIAAVTAKGQTLPASLIDVSVGVPVSGTFSNGEFLALPSGVLRFTDFDAFCVEPLQEISFGQSLVYNIQDPGSLDPTYTIARLVGGFLASSRSANDAAAVQWAIWEITGETTSGPSLSDGNVRISPDNQAIADLANLYLGNVGSYTPASLTHLSNTEFQDVVTWNVVPEPGSAALAALSAVMLLRRRRH